MSNFEIRDEPVKGDLKFETFDIEEPAAHHNFIPVDTSNKQVGLTREQLRQYERDPFYVKLRWAILILIGLIILGLITFVIVSVIILPACPPRPKLTFNQKDIFYQIEVANYKDSNGDGIGDLKGIKQKLGYISEDLGAKIVCLNRFISKATPMEIDPVYGDENDLNNLKKELKKKSMFLIIDLPASYIDNGEDKKILKHWLTNYADGIRLIDGEQYLNSDKFKVWRGIVDDIAANTFKEKYFGIIERSPLIFNTHTFTSAPDFMEQIENLYKDSDDTKWPKITLGQYNSPRLVLSSTLTDLAHSIVLLLKGTPIIRAGDEIKLKGITEIENYMQWDDTEGCGFTNNTEIGFYLKNHTSCANAVLSSVSHSSGSKSLVKIYRELSTLRQQPSFAWGKVNTKNDNKIISFTRQAEGFEGYLVAANTGISPENIDFKEKHSIPEDDNSVIVYSYSPEDQSDFVVDEEIDLSNVLLKPGQLLVVKLLLKK